MVLEGPWEPGWRGSCSAYDDTVPILRVCPPLMDLHGHTVGRGPGFESCPCDWSESLLFPASAAPSGKQG